jgi:hypothetical protein
MTFVKVLTDVNGVVSLLPAKIINSNADGTFNIQYLSKTEKLYNGKSIYEYEPDIYVIQSESIEEYMYDETEMHFKLVNETGSYIRDRRRDDSDIDDPTYVYEDDEEDDGSDEDDEDDGSDDDEDDGSYDDED